jgi:hypothetical protein
MKRTRFARTHVVAEPLEGRRLLSAYTPNFAISSSGGAHEAGSGGYFQVTNTNWNYNGQPTWTPTPADVQFTLTGSAEDGKDYTVHGSFTFNGEYARGSASPRRRTTSWRAWRTSRSRSSPAAVTR